MPQPSADGRTVTIRIRPGIRYSAPLAGRTVTAADVAYALTRDLEPRTGNGYASLYYADIAGARDVLAGRTEKLAGVETPNATTLVIHVVRPTGAISTAQARNPEWNGRDTGDFRPARLDSITFHSGRGIDAASRAILAGRRMVSGDIIGPARRLVDSAPPGQVVRRQADLVRFIALNTRVAPFDDVRVRRAVAAVVDKQALLATLGGPRFGTVATHVISPGVAGFAAAGGTAGPGFAFTEHPRGSVRLARAYLRKAGYRDGRYHGRRLLLVGDENLPAANTARVVARGWQKDFFDAQSLLDPVFDGTRLAPGFTYDYAQVDDPEINREPSRARALADPAARAPIYARVDRRVTRQAYVVPWVWANNVLLRSGDVRGVVSRFNSVWDLTFTALR